MRVTNKGARAFFIWTLLAFIVMLCVIGYSMAEAFNLSPYTFKLRSKTTAADSLYIKGDTLYADQMAVSLAAVLKAVAVQTDTVRGSSSIVGVLDSAIRIDPDSSSAVVVITFGGYGGGLRWDRSTDAMQYTNDFSTWTDIGTGGSSTTNADSLDGAVAHVRPLTDGYYLRYAATGDSLYLAAVTGSTDEDSIFVAHKSSRWMPLPDSTPQYIGSVTDSAMLWYNLTDDNIIAFVKIFYNEDVDDSALVTWGSMLAQIATSGNGDITGVITSDWLTGGASSGDVALGIDPDILAALYLTTDTTVLEGIAVKARTSDYASSVTLIDDTVSVQNSNAGKIILNVDGTPTNTDEMTITENNIEIRSAGSNGVMVLSGYDVERVSFGAAGTMFMGTGTSSAPAFYSAQTVLDTLFSINLNIRDTVNAFLGRAETISGNWVNTANPWADNEVADNITAGYADSTGKTTHGSVDKWDLATNSIDSTKIVDAGVGYADLGVGAVNKIKATVVDSATGALRASLLIGAQGSANTAGRLTLDSLIADTLFATRGNFTNFKLGTDVFLTDITGDGLAVSGSALTASLGTAITSSEITDDEILWADFDSVDAKNAVRDVAHDTLWANTPNYFKTAGNGLTSSTSTVNLVAGANGLTVNADSVYIDTTKIARFEELRANWLIPWPDSALGLGSGAGLTIGSSITLGTDITDSIRRDIQIPEYNAVVYPRGYDATDLATYDSTKIQIRAGHDATGSYVVCIDSIVWATDHSRYAVLAFPAPDSVVRLNRILIQASSAENAADSGMVWAGLKKNSVDSAGTKFHLEDLADRDSTSTSALDTLVLDNTSGLVPEAYTDGDVAYVVVKFTTKAGNGRSGVASYYIRKAWAEWVRDKL